MSKLTNRSRIYLKKIKAQMGTFVNNPMFQDSVRQATNYALTPENLRPTPVEETTPENSGLDTLEMLSPALKIGMGIRGLVNSGREKRWQEVYKKESEKDLNERRDAMRANSFYMTPYTVGKSDDLTLKKGGQVYQQGGTTPMDAFMNFYNQQEQSKKQVLQTLEEGYSDKNENLKSKWRAGKAEAWGSIGEGATFAIDAAKQAAGMMMQEGGELEGIPESEDLYSENFVSPYEVKEQVENELKTESPGENMQGNTSLMSWLFEEEPLQTYTVSDIYDAKYSKPAGGEMPISPVGGSIAVSHSNPGNIKYGQFAQKYGASPGRAAKDGGIFAVFPTVEAGLQAQKDLLVSKNYANLTVADAMKRWSNSGYGADLYPEVANKKMKDLTPQELTTLVRKQIQREDGNMYKKLFK